MTHHPACQGYSLMELMFATGIGVTMSAVAVPQYFAAIDDFRAAGATRYISSRLQRARMEAVVRSTEVAMQFAETIGGYGYAVYRDGNRNGVLTRDIQDGIDRLIAPIEQLLMGQNVVARGLGKTINPDSKNPSYKQLARDILSDARFAERAREFAAKYADFDLAQQIDRIVTRCEEIIGNEGGREIYRKT